MTLNKWDLLSSQQDMLRLSDANNSLINWLQLHIGLHTLCACKRKEFLTCGKKPCTLICVLNWGTAFIMMTFNFKYVLRYWLQKPLSVHIIISWSQEGWKKWNGKPLLYMWKWKVGETLGVFGSNLSSEHWLSWRVFRGLPHSLQANARLVPQLCQDCFLSNPVYFFIHQSS
jgi:hypothetical protein